ncbi:MAG: aminopeptidase P family protein [Deltaproteobacteria bacterium]|nr:aminopeptidase P family protein [Deltaproteobacteria bacterium]
MSAKNVSDIRKLMEEHGYDAFLIPSTDPHQSEYVPDYWKRRQFASSFTGSAGDLVILKDRAGLWTDSRYFIQAEAQLSGTGIELHKMMTPDSISIPEYLLKYLKEKSVVAFDGSIMSETEFLEMKSVLQKKNIILKSSGINLVDAIWKDRPQFPDGEIFPLDERFTGLKSDDKLKSIREVLNSKNGKALVFSTLDDIAWITNLRGNDIKYTPVFISYLVITMERAVIYSGIEKFSKSAWEKISGTFEVEPYHRFEEDLHNLGGENDKILISGSSLTVKLADIIRKHSDVEVVNSGVEKMKGIKNPTELQGMRNSHIRDGVAMVKFLIWLENNIKSGQSITEVSAAKYLGKLRHQQENNRGESFETISAFGKNGAIVHYTASQDQNSPITGNGLYLLDSGGQYLDGTTDITRTISIGTPDKHMKKMYTMVLKGHIDLASAVFPEGTTGKQLDTIARKPLWDKALNYGHGTGHGVGMFLGVHEGPHAISYYRCQGVPLEAGMVTTIEPGYYEEGNFGIRIENMYITVEDSPETELSHKFLRFENITWCPLDNRLIDFDDLSSAQKNWVCNYHEKCLVTLSPYLTGEEQKWLETFIANE